jgi:hypothetical protein
MEVEVQVEYGLGGLPRLGSLDTKVGSQGGIEERK